MNATPIAPDVFRTEPRLHLVGGRHRTTGRIVFPLPANADYEPVELPDRGTLWSFTVQRFAPKAPPYRGALPFLPFAVGYVELPGAVIVESRLADAPFEALKVGMPMELTTLDLPYSNQDMPARCFAFRPCTAEHAR